jgi:hypothetical protein
VEIQYLRTTISDQQREEFGRLVESTIRRTESTEFLPHSGIRFPKIRAAVARTSAFVSDGKTWLMLF